MNKQYHIIGLMSGTSLDGLDIVKCTFKKEVNWSFQLENFETIKYSEKWRNTLKNLHLRNKKDIIHFLRNSKLNYTDISSEPILILSSYNEEFITYGLSEKNIFYDIDKLFLEFKN